MAISQRMHTLIHILLLQGVLLFLVSVWELSQINLANLLLVLTETLLFKALFVPLFLKYIIRKNKINRAVEPFMNGFYSLLIAIFFVIISYLLGISLNISDLQVVFFTGSLAAIFTGILLTVARKKLITHIIGYVVIENGVFLLSLSVGAEMPWIVNMAILMDIFLSILMLGLFTNKIGTLEEQTDKI